MNETRPAAGGTWITPDYIAAARELEKSGPLQTRFRCPTCGKMGTRIGALTAICGRCMKNFRIPLEEGHITRSIEGGTQ